MSHELQTPLWASWLLEAQAELLQASMQPTRPWDLRPISQHSPTLERLLSHLPHIPEPEGNRWGWLAGEGTQQVVMHCLWTSELTLYFPPACFQLPTCPLSACQLCLTSPGVPRCSPSQLLGFVWWARLLHQMHPSPLFTTTPLLSNHKSFLSSHNAISDSDSHPLLPLSGGGF